MILLLNRQIIKMKVTLRVNMMKKIKKTISFYVSTAKMFSSETIIYFKIWENYHMLLYNKKWILSRVKYG